MCEIRTWSSLEYVLVPDAHRARSRMHTSCAPHARAHTQHRRIAFNVARECVHVTCAPKHLRLLAPHKGLNPKP
jgi:hypothetical protein